MYSDNAQKLMAAVDTLDTEVRDNVRRLMSEVARNQSLLVDTLNTTVRQTLDTGKLLLTCLKPDFILRLHCLLEKRSIKVKLSTRLILLYDK